MIITIDGPAGAGKSSVSRALARRLGFRFLDTGAMYRAVALAGMRRGVDWSRPEELAQLARGLDLRLADDRVLSRRPDVTAAIRRSDVTAVTRYAADNLGVRGHLVDLQRAIAGTNNLVTEGRDQGTVVFPAAECKFFLTAGEDERARRRFATWRPAASGPRWRKSWPPSGDATRRTPPGRSGPCCPPRMPSASAPTDSPSSKSRTGWNR